MENIKRAENPNRTIAKKSAQRSKDSTHYITDILSDLTVTKTVKKNLESRQFDDPFLDAYEYTLAGGKLRAIEPVHNPNVLRRIPLENNILLQCIEAMVLNIEGTDHQIEYIGPDEDNTFKDRPEVRAEKERMESFLSGPNEEYGLTELRRRMRRDKETFGYAFFEVVRDQAGFIHAVYHVPAHSVRLTCNDPTPVNIVFSIRRGENIVKINRNKYFRRFIQSDSMDANYVFFKEFGDPRVIDYRTGEEAKAGEVIPTKYQASEILMLSDYRSGYLYGQPRWINQIPSILGSRESEILNLNFFRDNGIPAMAVLVSGGFLSQDAVDAIGDKFSRNRGRDKMHQVLILEAYGDDQGSSQDGVMPIPKLEFKSMVDERQNDALFQEYDKECQRKIRMAFRLPDIMMGGSESYTHAVADASMVMVESQVFQPERNEVDDFINKYFLGDGVNPPKYWRFRSNPTRIVDGKQIASSLTVLNNIGALTPNDAINVSNQLFNLKIRPIKHVWADYPYSMVLKLIEKGHPIQDMEELIDISEKLRLESVELEQNQSNKDNSEVAAKKEAIDSVIDMMDVLSGQKEIPVVQS